MPFYPWVDQLVENVTAYLNDKHKKGRSHTDMPRGAYFYRYHWNRFRLGERKFSAFHIVINNYPNNNGVLYCAARLETSLIGQYNIGVPQNIINLFNQLLALRVQPNSGYATQGPEAKDLGIISIPLPGEFIAEDKNQVLPDNLWNDILMNFLTNNPQLNAFLGIAN